MRLTLINQFYPPDLAPTGHLAADLAQHRAELGDRVTVITSRGGYVPASGSSSPRTLDNLRIYRLWTPKLGKGSLVRRLIDYGLFYLQATATMAVLPRQDLVVSMTTPPFIAWTAALHKRLHPGTKLIQWNMDCYPEVLERAGSLSPGGWPSRLMRWLNRRIFKGLDHVVCLDAAMERLLSSQYQPTARAVPTTVISNWEPESLYSADDRQLIWQPGLELDLAARFVVLYLGNAGYGHRFETLVDAADQLRSEEVAFVFVGGGQRWNWLERAKHERSLDNLHLFSYVPKEMTPSIMGLADCSLITLRDSYLGVISPSKLHSSLAMGLPILYIGPEGGNVDEAIQRFECGVSLRHGDVERVVSFIRRLMQNPAAQQSLSQRARRGFETAYADSVALPEFDRLLDQLASG